LLDVHGDNLIELAGEIRDDAIDAGRRKLVRKVEAAISEMTRSPRWRKHWTN
jgi:hypothetical protein